ncbi:hypothetical protein DFA_04295 [Cavenderia fasciculata]|uniref:Ankyrin repeat-containing protein n=1 Tax=Cavenderia fasciculata TaxID=261658 RepID=F4PP64_CACFS|nr:uncharacterized protein DFA_04295 [Cavenderia fasciculata]EGG22177.1 hypothetical protein DFA_04295 [Cavenderia fasciculata]|eukprot:XP_004360028.1 hypothetical protein DFA_04295 [Cavenderia fasciculata]
MSTLQSMRIHHSLYHSLGKMDKELIIMIFRNRYLKEMIFNFDRSEQQKQDRYSISITRVYRYDDWYSADHMIRHRHFGLLINKLQRGISVAFTNKSIELICQEVKDTEQWRALYQLKRSSFVGANLVWCACLGGNIEIIQTLLEQEHPVRLSTQDVSNISSSVTPEIRKLLTDHKVKCDTHHDQRIVGKPLTLNTDKLRRSYANFDSYKSLDSKGLENAFQEEDIELAKRILQHKDFHYSHYEFIHKNYNHRFIAKVLEVLDDPNNGIPRSSKIYLTKTRKTFKSSTMESLMCHSSSHQLYQLFVTNKEESYNIQRMVMSVGNIEFLKYIHTSSDPSWILYDISSALRVGRYDVIEYMVDTYTTKFTLENILLSIAMSGQSQTLDYFLNKKPSLQQQLLDSSIVDPKQLINHLIRENHLEMLLYLFEKVGFKNEYIKPLLKNTNMKQQLLIVLKQIGQSKCK